MVERDAKVELAETGGTTMGGGSSGAGLWKRWHWTEMVVRCLDGGRKAKIGEGEHNTFCFMHEVHDAHYLDFISVCFFQYQI